MTVATTATAFQELLKDHQNEDKLQTSQNKLQATLFTEDIIQSIRSIRLIGSTQTPRVRSILHQLKSADIFLPMASHQSEDDSQSAVVGVDAAMGTMLAQLASRRHEDDMANAGQGQSEQPILEHVLTWSIVQTYLGVGTSGLTASSRWCWLNTRWQ